MLEKPGYTLNNEHGVVIVLLAFLLPVLAGFIGLFLDLGVFFLNKKDIQAIADACSAAAADHFTEFDTSTRTYLDTSYRYPGEESLSSQDCIDGRFAAMQQDFKDSKMAVLATLKAYAPLTKGINSTALTALQNETMLFNTGASNSNSMAPDYNSHTNMTATSGNLTVSFTRGIRCYSGTDKLFCPIDTDVDNWTYANAVLTTITIQQTQKYFSKIFNGGSNPNMTVTAISYVPETTPPACGVPSCADLGTGSFMGTCTLISAIM